MAHKVHNPPKCTSHHWPGARRTLSSPISRWNCSMRNICLALLTDTVCKHILTWENQSLQRHSLLRSFTRELVYHQSVPINWAKEFWVYPISLNLWQILLIPLVQMSKKKWALLFLHLNVTRISSSCLRRYWQKPWLEKFKNHTADSFHSGRITASICVSRRDGSVCVYSQRTRSRSCLSTVVCLDCNQF